MDYAQEIARDPVLPQECIPAHCIPVRGGLALGDAVAIVHLLRTVEAKPYGKTLCRQKAAPLLVEESAVRLYPVGNAPVAGAMFALERYDLAKVIEPQDGRFPAMPGKVDHRTGRGIDVLDDVFFQDRVGHAKRLAHRIEVFLLQVVTIVAVQVAGSAGRLGKNLEFAGSFGHRSILDLRPQSPGHPSPGALTGYERAFSK